MSVQSSKVDEHVRETSCERLRAKKPAGAKRGEGLGRAFPVLSLTFGLLHLSSNGDYGGGARGEGVVKNIPRSLGGVVELTIGNTREIFIPHVLK